MSLGRVTLGHANTLKKILGIPSLGQKQVAGRSRDGDVEEVMQGAKICHGKLRVEASHDGCLEAVSRRRW
jgi:hypothetical protein